MTTQKAMPRKWAQYYNQKNILEEIKEESVTVTLAEGLLQDIVSGKRKRKLKNISIRMDPLHVKAIKKLATMKAIPYQTLVRHWLAEDIRKGLDSVEKKKNAGRNDISEATRGAMNISKADLKAIMEEEGVYETH